MLAKTNAAAVHGVDARTIEVEVNSGQIGKSYMFIKETVWIQILNTEDIAKCDILPIYDL